MYSLFFGFLIANVCMFVFGINSVKIFTKVLSVPKSTLVPIIFVLCFVGSYALKNNIFDVGVMLFFGIIGYAFQKAEISASPAILGLILGPMAESNFRRALLMSEGDPRCFVSTGISKFFLVLILISLILPYLQKKYFGSRKKEKRGTDL